MYPYLHLLKWLITCVKKRKVIFLINTLRADILICMAPILKRLHPLIRVSTTLSIRPRDLSTERDNNVQKKPEVPLQLMVFGFK